MNLIQTLDESRLSSYGRMIDDRIVNNHMATVDTEIDRYILRARLSDEMRNDVTRVLVAWDQSDDIREAIQSMRFMRSLDVRRTIAAWHEHNNRADDLQHMIEEIRSGDGFTIEAERHADIGFGRYDGNDDKYLAFVLDWAGSDYADEETGATDWEHHVMRFGRVLLWADDQGFKTLEVCGYEDAAKRIFAECDQRYGDWMSSDAPNYD